MGIARHRPASTRCERTAIMLAEGPKFWGKEGMQPMYDENMQDEQQRDLADDLRDTTQNAKDIYDKGKRLKNAYDKFRGKNNPAEAAGHAGSAGSEAGAGGATGAGGMMPKGASAESASGAAQAGGDLAANTAAAGAAGGDVAAGASASAAGGAGATAGTGASAAGGAAAAEAGGAAAGSAAAGGAAGGAAAAGGTAGGAAAAPVLGIGCLVVLAVILGIVLLMLLVYLILLPVNVLTYNADASGDGITSWSESVGQDLSVSKYDFMMGMYDLSSAFEDFAFHILHPGQAVATDAILNELNSKDMNLAEDKFAPEYTDTTNSMVVTLDGAFRKGWARTAQTAEYRAKMIEVQSSGGTHKVVDEYDSEEMWNSDDYWADTSNWKKESDYYIAGTFSGSSGSNYRGQCTDELVTITSQITADIDGDGIPDTEDDDVSQPSYMDAIMKVIALQNCAEQTIILDNNEEGNIKQYGIDATYQDDTLTDDGTVSAEDKMKSTEYQLLRLAGEIAGRGIQRQDLNTDKEFSSIYQITTSTQIVTTPVVHNVEVEYLSGQHQEPTLDDDGEYQYDANNQLITHTVYEYSWKHDHYEVCLQVSVNTTYSVGLRKDAKDVIAKELTKTNSAEEQAAFYDAVDSYYAMQYELLCDLYDIVPYAWDYGGGGSNGYQPGMTEEEIKELLEQLQLDPDSARGALVQIALSSVGKFTYNQSNGFRTGVNSGLYSPGNANYTGTELDCSSFVQYCYFVAGIPFSPTNTSGYASAISSGELVRISVADVRPGDLQVVYPTGSYEGHVWMYVGNNTWCECTPNGGVRADNWSKNFMSSHPSVYVRSALLP